MKKVICICLLFAFVLISCAPGSSVTLPPDMTLVPGTDIPQQVATYISNALTQTSVAMPATVIPAFGPIPTGYESSTPIPVPALIQFPYQTLYQSSVLGIQFIYPSTWYRSETNGIITLSSFEPSNPPHKLEWRYEDTSIQFGFKVFITSPGSFDEWVENARQIAYADQLTISEEERFSIANQPAHRLSLVSGSGGVINQILTTINGRYIEINAEGNYNNNLTRAVMGSIQPYSADVIKPAKGDTPAAGVCGGASDPVNIILGYLEGDMFPIMGRCIAVDPAQRIKLINNSGNPIELDLMGYPMTLPVGSEILLDKPVNQYLASGVHNLPMGPELWVKTTDLPTFTPTPPPVLTVPPPLIEYNNSVLGYRLNLPGDWSINDTDSSGREVIFSPPYAEPFIVYLSISLDSRTLNQVINFYAQNVQGAVREDTIFYGYPAVKYFFASGRNEYFIPYGNQLFMISTDRPNDGIVQSILTTFRYIVPPQPIIYEATMADNGKTFIMNIGDALRLSLDLGYDWSAFSISNPAVIIGAQDRFIAYSGGTAILTTTGNPGCLRAIPPCGMPSIMFSITIHVP